MGVLAEKQCIPCQGGIPPLTKEEIQPFFNQLENNWDVINAHHLEKNFEFNNFVHALDFVNKVGSLAEEVGHHPNLYIHSYKYVKVEVWTHKIDGLAESDFVLAAKIERLI